jgi:hypothetical protein
MSVQEQDGIEKGISRRAAVASSGVGLLGLLCGSVLGQEKAEAGRKGPPREMQERMEQSKAFSERLRNASSMEERMKIIQERNEEDRRRAVEELKRQLRVSDQEWAVVKPRVEKVYDLVHPVRLMDVGNNQKKSEVDERSRELRELLGDEGANADQIKAKLTALRAAKEKATQELAAARQSLRQIMNLRQEAVLVLNGLLD